MTDTTTDPATPDTAAAADGAPPAEGTPPAGEAAAALWWQDGKRFDEQTRTMLEAKGLTTDDPLEAMAKLSGLYRHAETRLGKPADSLLDKPKDGVTADWLRENGELFGVPEAADGYKIERPDSWPEDAAWDDKAEAAFRGKAHELGLSDSQAQGMVELYAQTVAESLGTANEGLQAAQDKLQAELQKDWGDSYLAKVSQAQQAWQAAAEQAGLPAEASTNAAAMLSEKLGDASVLRLFAALGDMMGEDSLPRVGGGGGHSLTTTPAEARAELAAMRDPGSDYMKAVQARNEGQPVPNWTELQERRARLTKLAAST